MEDELWYERQICKICHDHGTICKHCNICEACNTSCDHCLAAHSMGELMRILWIDDEPSRWKLLQRALMTGTYLRKHVAVEDVVFAHGHEQINHYLNNDMHWDYVLLDGDMFLMSGVDVAQTFLAERNIPVIIVTMNPDKAKQMAAIFNDYEVPYVLAPITNPELIVKALSR